MPTRPPLYRPTYALSPTLAQSREAYERQRGSAASRGYDHRWRAFRASVLASNPLCADRLARGALTPAADVHHVVKLRMAPGRRLDPTNVSALCSVCHARRTGRGARLTGRALVARAPMASAPVRA
jgi:5-methylcytosine-specific restriction enzyme A